MEIKYEGTQALRVSGKINKSNLKQNQYTVSLLHEAFRAGLLNRQELNNIQVQVMLILKDLILNYTKGESSSVTTEIAERLLNSILYSIDAYTLSCGSPEAAIKHLQTIDLKIIYKKGVERVYHWFEETKKLYKEIIKNRLYIQLESYNLTINEAIPLFFKKYNILFDSHSTMTVIDYPLVFDDMSIRGVLYIKNYLEHLRIETEFCKYFNVQDIEKVLSNFGRMIGMDYKIELINIFELVFNNAVFSAMSGNIAGNLVISKYHFNLLNKKLKSLSTEEISLSIEAAIKKLIDSFNINDSSILDYIDQYKTIFIQRSINAVKNDSLSSIIVTEKEEKAKGNVLVLKEGERMSNDKFNLVIKKLTKLTRTADKINFIKSTVSSLYDFIDILNSNCLFGNEFKALFNVLDNMELAVLVKVIFYEELRDGFSRLSSILSNGKKVEIEWKIHFIEFVKELSEERVQLIESCLSKIEFEEIKFY